MVASFLSFYGSFSAKIACIWLSVWAIRRKAEVDYPWTALRVLSAGRPWWLGSPSGTMCQDQGFGTYASLAGFWL